MSIRSREAASRHIQFTPTQTPVESGGLRNNWDGGEGTHTPSRPSQQLPANPDSVANVPFGGGGATYRRSGSYLIAAAVGTGNTGQTTAVPQAPWGQESASSSFNIPSQQGQGGPSSAPITTTYFVMIDDRSYNRFTQYPPTTLIFQGKNFYPIFYQDGREVRYLCHAPGDLHDLNDYDVVSNRLVKTTESDPWIETNGFRVSILRPLSGFATLNDRPVDLLAEIKSARILQPGVCDDVWDRWFHRPAADKQYYGVAIPESYDVSHYCEPHKMPSVLEHDGARHFLICDQLPWRYLAHIVGKVITRPIVEGNAYPNAFIQTTRVSRVRDRWVLVFYETDLPAGWSVDENETVAQIPNLVHQTYPPNLMSPYGSRSNSQVTTTMDPTPSAGPPPNHLPNHPPAQPSRPSASSSETTPPKTPTEPLAPPVAGGSNTKTINGRPRPPTGPKRTSADLVGPPPKKGTNRAKSSPKSSVPSPWAPIRDAFS